jgi:hypothetical protein
MNVFLAIVTVALLILAWKAYTATWDEIELRQQIRRGPVPRPRGRSMMPCDRWGKTLRPHPSHTWAQSVNGGGLGMIGVPRWCPGESQQEVAVRKQYKQRAAALDEAYRKGTSDPEHRIYAERRAALTYLPPWLHDFELGRSRHRETMAMLFQPTPSNYGWLAEHGKSDTGYQAHYADVFPPERIRQIWALDHAESERWAEHRRVELAQLDGSPGAVAVGAARDARG